MGTRQLREFSKMAMVKEYSERINTNCEGMAVNVTAEPLVIAATTCLDHSTKTSNFDVTLLSNAVGLSLCNHITWASTDAKFISLQSCLACDRKYPIKYNFLEVRLALQILHFMRQACC